MRAVITLLLGLLLSPGPREQGERGTGTSSPGIAEETPQTAETCAACHEEQVTGTAAGPHGLAMKRSSESLFQNSCVACHGNAAAHLESPAKENIRRVPGVAACVSCHAASGNVSLSSPAHARGQVACLSCHASGHKKPGSTPLLIAGSHDLCGSCHMEQKSATLLPYAHRDGRRPFECKNCHSVHGKGRQGRLLDARNGGACIDCHTDLAGPFVFPHAPRETGGACVTCHVPHGSTNPRMLTRRSISSLCLECHTSLGSSHDQTKPRYRNCTTCHIAIHGSNHDPKLFDE
ncbi:MAG: hypothetical protein DIJKHBIC_00518 [Thermoanaerobaculia bacterium]|nr:hypothetical protein [Thermoanaerobaculia bacterium]